jgi:hypothetical protein
MSDANFSLLAAQPETTWGTTPSPATALKKIRLTSESLQHEKETIMSEEVRSDRQISDLAQVGAAATGSFDFELSHTDFQTWLEAALFTDIVTVAVTASLALNHTTQVITGAAGDFDDVIAGCFVKIAGAANAGNNGPKLVVAKATNGSTITLAAGSLTATETTAVTISGKHAKNGSTRKSFSMERRIEDTAGAHHFQTYAGMMVDTLSLNIESKAIVTGSVGLIGRYGEAPDESLLDSAAAKATGTLTFTANPHNNDTVTIGGRTYTFKTSLGATAGEVHIGASASASLDNLIAAINNAAGGGTAYAAATTVHATVTAAAGAGDTMVVTAKANGTAGNAIGTTETFTAAGNVFGASTLSGGVNPQAYVEASTDPVLNGTANVGQLRKDGVAMGEHFKSVSLEIANNLRGKDAIGSLGNFDIGVGSCEVTGSFQAYFRNNDLLADFIAHTYTSLSLTLTDGNGAVMGLHLPRLNFSTGNANISGKDSDVMQPLDFTAILSETYGGTIFLSWLDA